MNFAKIENGKVVTIIRAEQDVIDSGVLGDPSTFKQWKRDGSIRSNPAVIGGTYDADQDKFFFPQPFASWTLDANDNWVPPIAKPTDGGHYYWDEEAQAWAVGE
jgi:hypothetical protein|tara:strand:- start:48 stop:359 length:312 start_codon:yes stop_codon:yes gene_type:complete